LELGKRSLPLPVLLNVHLPSEVTPPPLKATSQMEGWEGITVMLEGGPFDENPIPEALSTSLREAMDGSGLGRWKGLAGLYGARVLPDIGEGPVQAEVISSMLLPILLKDPRTFARAMGRLKEEAPCHPPVYVPGAANGTNLDRLRRTQRYAAPSLWLLALQRALLLFRHRVPFVLALLFAGLEGS